MIKNLLKKKIGFISIELVIIAAIVLVSGFVAVGSFVEDGQVASNDAADKIDDTLLLAGGGLPGGLPAVPGGDGISYYDNLTLAMEDIGAGTLGANANSDTSGKIMAYVNKNGETVVVLMDNLSATSSATITTDTSLILNGYKITTEGTSAIVIESGTLKIDGSKAGSEIMAKNAGSGSALTQNGGEVILNGGKYTVEGGNKGIALKIAGGTMQAVNAAIASNGANGMYGVAVQSGATFNGDKITVTVEGSASTVYGVYVAGNFDINNSTINANTVTGKLRALYVTSAGNGVVSNSSIVGTCDVYKETSVASSQGINNAGTLTVNNCYVWGSHSGVTNSGAIEVNGGTYESPGHGGMYFGNLVTPAYIRDAVLRHTPAPENSVNADYNEGGFYIGGGSDRNGVVVYMDNCEIYGENNAFALRGTSGEHDNKLYMSNCRLTGTGFVRIDNNTHELYLGVGNNFDGSDAKNVDQSQSMVSQVFHTTETYR